MIENNEGLFGFVLLLVSLGLLQRQLHIEIQAIFLFITRRKDIALILFSVLFFPGVLMHEGSHYIAARILGVKTGHFSLLPHPLQNGRLQLGFVEASPTDIFRDALIGVAPFFSGVTFIVFVALSPLELPDFWEPFIQRDAQVLISSFRTLINRPDFWLWFYLVFVVSSMMFPSRSDRRAWLPILIITTILLGLGLLVGAGPWISQNLLPWLNRVLWALSLVLAVSVLVHLVLLPPLWLLRFLFSRFGGLKIA